ncbi:MAG TPA: hypothetical protein VKS79_24550, partial [Gemmataceae bacterium]|nr:hypothetical protein [Gemmataceae bacterium]
IVLFSSKNLDPARLPEETNPFANLMMVKHWLGFPRGGNRTDPPPTGVFTSVGPFGDSWQRTLTMKTAMGGTEPILQRLTTMTPYGIQLAAVDFRWTEYFLLNELDHGLVRDLLLKHRDFKESAGAPDLEKRMKLHQFFVQAKWYQDADKELDRTLKDIPTAKARVETARTALRDLQAQEVLDEANRAVGSGQFRLASELLKGIPPEGLGNVTVKVNTAKVRFDNLTKQWDLAQRFLYALPENVLGPNAEILCEAAEAIRNDLYIEGLDRLEPFINLAEQAAKAQQLGRIPAQKAEELLSLAVTGWLLGKESAETKPETARKLWKARNFVLTYVRTHNVPARRRMLEAYQKDEPVELEELARIVAVLPPPEPGDKVTPEPQERRTALANNNNRAPANYVLQLPLEYRHGRPYPLLVVMHNTGERAQAIFDRYKYWANRNGYILASVDWETIPGAYNYSAEEHYRVLDAIRDIKQHYHVDSDRIFLGGFAEGGNVAWDVGTAQPDMFAGITGITAQPRMTYVRPLWPNAKYLPFYLVGGEMAGDAPKQTMMVVGEWLSKGFPALYCFYRGRGTEWFGGELPFMFDWMKTKQRAKGWPDLGSPNVGQDGVECFHTMRNEDSRFYWITADKIAERNLHENKPKGASALPARIQATIKAGNQIVFYTVGVKEASLWFGPGMIDFTKPVSVFLKGIVRGGEHTIKQTLKPDLAVMMEDLYDRWDQQRVFFCKWTINP